MDDPVYISFNIEETYLRSNLLLDIGLQYLSFGYIEKDLHVSSSSKKYSISFTFYHLCCLYLF